MISQLFQHRFMALRGLFVELDGSALAMQGMRECVRAWDRAAFF